MSASSGIGVAPELVEQFSAATSNNIRALKVSISNETLVYDGSLDVSGSLEEDLPRLQDMLEANTPAYLLVRMDNPSVEWLSIFYVPDSARVRDKMLYSSSRHSLTKSLGSTVFTDSIFATSKEDLTPQAYASHKRHRAAPQPLSAREQELADVRAAEREAGGGGYDGSRSRKNHVGKAIGFNWSPEVEEAVRELGEGEGNRLVVICIEPSSETLNLHSAADVSVEELGSALPSAEPCYAFFAWSHNYSSPPRREIVFIYSCPSSSPMKYRMVYSCGAVGVFKTATPMLLASSPLASSPSVLSDRKIETSDPMELNEGFLKVELGLDQGAVGNAGGSGTTMEEKKPFAKPRGPGRR